MTAHKHVYTGTFLTGSCMTAHMHVYNGTCLTGSCMTAHTRMYILGHFWVGCAWLWSYIKTYLPAVCPLGTVPSVPLASPSLSFSYWSAHCPRWPPVHCQLSPVIISTFSWYGLFEDHRKLSQRRQRDRSMSAEIVSPPFLSPSPVWSHLSLVTVMAVCGDTAVCGKYF